MQTLRCFIADFDRALQKKQRAGQAIAQAQGAMPEMQKPRDI
jgi:hypothetical protein